MSFLKSVTSIAADTLSCISKKAQSSAEKLRNYQTPADREQQLVNELNGVKQQLSDILQQLNPPQQ